MASRNSGNGIPLMATGVTIQSPDGSWVTASWVYDTKDVTYSYDEYAGGYVVVAYWGDPEPTCGDPGAPDCGSCSACQPDLARRGII
jgi:hypothetical protein